MRREDLREDLPASYFLALASLPRVGVPIHLIAVASCSPLTVPSDSQCGGIPSDRAQSLSGSNGNGNGAATSNHSRRIPQGEPLNWNDPDEAAEVEYFVAKFTHTFLSFWHPSDRGAITDALVVRIAGKRIDQLIAENQRLHNRVEELQSFVLLCVESRCFRFLDVDERARDLLAQPREAKPCSQ